jgi:small-conductance mechanosensitive channel/CRP-like cAMP-binding protein
MQHALSAFARGELTSLGGVGIIVAAVLIAVLRVLLPPSERPRLRMPLVLLVLHIGVVFLRGFLPHAAAAHKPLAVLAVMLLFLSIGRTAFLFLIEYMLGRRLDHPLPRIIRDILQGLIYAAVAIVTLRAAGVEPTSLLATSALLTAVIGLSMQETLGNMFAGLSIQVQRPFEVGDWIQFDTDPNNTGRVVEINWRATKIQTSELVEVTVPNGMIAKAPIRNFSKPATVVRRSAFVQAPYDVPPGRVHELILTGLTDVPGVLADPPPSVITRGFMDSGIEYWARYFIDRFADRDVIASRVRDRIWYTFNRGGVSIPFPIRTVNLHEAEHVAQKDAQARSSRRDRILRCVDFLAALPDEALQLLAGRSRVRRYGAGEQIIHQGDTGAELFIIDRGEVAILRGVDGGEIEVARLGPTQFFGEMSLTTGESRTATVRALYECELLVVDKEALQEVLEAAPELAQTISAVVAARQVGLEASEALSQRSPAIAVEEKTHQLLGRIRDFFKL